MRKDPKTIIKAVCNENDIDIKKVICFKYNL